jgi:hypothetical protein
MVVSIGGKHGEPQKERTTCSQIAMFVGFGRSKQRFLQAAEKQIR